MKKNFGPPEVVHQSMLESYILYLLDKKCRPNSCIQSFETFSLILQAFSPFHIQCLLQALKKVFTTTVLSGVTCVQLPTGRNEDYDWAAVLSTLTSK